MEDIIYLTCYGGLHFGNGTIDLNNFQNCYFEEEFPVDDKIHKAIIIKIDYLPDSYYSITDTHAGKCWLAHVLDSRNVNGNQIIKYYFRNLGDLIIYYRHQGFKLIDLKSL